MTTIKWRGEHSYKKRNVPNNKVRIYKRSILFLITNCIDPINDEEDSIKTKECSNSNIQTLSRMFKHYQECSNSIKNVQTVMFKHCQECSSCVCDLI